MTTAAWVYVVGYPFAVLLVMVNGELERRASSDPFERQATLRPALDGVIGGLAWPVLAACAAAFGLLWLLSAVGRVLVGVIDSLFAPSNPDEEF